MTCPATHTLPRRARPLHASPHRGQPSRTMPYLDAFNIAGA